MKAILEKSTIKLLIFLLGLTAISACQENGLYKEEVSVSSVALQEDYNALSLLEDQEQEKHIQTGMATSQIPKDIKIIKTASARYKVDNVNHTTKSIKVMAQKYHAYISELRFENNLYKKENRFTIKVPQNYFDVMMDSIGAIVEFVDYENITTKDVTEEYMDIQSRLETKKEVKRRYETILRKNAETVEDILKTEEKLRLIQEEIEAAEGRLNYLTHKVSYSTIQIDLYETVAYQEEPESYSKTFLSKSKEGLSFGWNLIENVIIGLFYFWPLILVGIVTVLIIRRKIKQRQSPTT
ncbi:DUF4349 domain-containing protein [Psychroserpens sp. BH13MA-6]